MSQVIVNGEVVPFVGVVVLMDEEICNDLHNEMAPCSDQEFVDAYVEAHAEKYDGEEFVVM